MFKLCVAIAVIGCMAVIIEGQTFNKKQTTRLPFYRQPFYQQNRFQQAARFPYYAQQRPGYYNPYAYNKNFLNNYYNRVYNSNEGLAKTITQHHNARPDGSYEYVYETENGIRGEERNIPKLVRSDEPSANAEGSYAYTSPEGLKVLVNYQADEDGFRPVLSYAGNGAAQFINNPNPSSVIINKRL